MQIILKTGVVKNEKKYIEFILLMIVIIVIGNLMIRKLNDDSINDKPSGSILVLNKEVIDL
ncbi:hypothetical protein [Senegalia sp. (in: firmicutes)]|uniref:hypothetical protein n=1 Tax=Senegalia sp. (in: firmicutes) TaxID=1924098 RepID=UPI003F98AF1A